MKQERDESCRTCCSRAMSVKKCKLPIQLECFLEMSRTDKGCWFALSRALICTRWTNKLRMSRPERNGYQSMALTSAPREIKKRPILIEVEYKTMERNYKHSPRCAISMLRNACGPRNHYNTLGRKRLGTRTVESFPCRSSYPRLLAPPPAPAQPPRDQN